FAAGAGRAGIGEGVFVVAYGNGGGPERLWWLLRHFGHADCAVLLGGRDVWGGELRAGEEEIEPAEFVPRERSGDTIAAAEIARRLADPSLALVDARTADRWRGAPDDTADPLGRLPGAATAPRHEPLEEPPLRPLEHAVRPAAAALRLAELDRPCQPEPAHVAHDLELVHERPRQLEEPFAEPRTLLHEPLLAQLVQRREPGRHRE